MPYTIRPMIPRDWDSVSRIYALGIATTYATFQQHVPSYEDWAVSHSEQGCFVLTDEDDAQEIYGWLAFSPVSSRSVYSGVMELSIYVHPDHQKQGIGRLLLLHALDIAPSLGIWTVQSAIIRENTGSISLHTRCGFRAVGFRERIARDVNGVWRDTIIFEKRLPNA